MLELLVTIAVLGLIAWLVLTYIPMAEPFKTIFVIAMVVICIVFLLNLVGLIQVGTLGTRFCN